MENYSNIGAAASALPFTLASYATPNFLATAPIEAPVWPPAKRRLRLTAKEWDELKPIIQQLYIDEGRTFREVMVFLQTNHNFTPTKKMFNDNIKKWEMWKNANRTRRKAILEEIHNGDSDDKDGKKTLSRLNPGKIERWEREEKLSGSLGNGKPVVEKEKAAGVLTARPTDQRLPDRALSPLREIIEISTGLPEAGKQYQTIWDMADIPGSPNLSRFHSFLKIAEEFPLPPPLRLPPRDPEFITSDDWSDLVKRPGDDKAEMRDGNLGTVVTSSRKSQRSSSVAKLRIYEWLLQQIEKPWTPLNEVYPFPIIVKTRKTRNGICVKISPAKTRELNIIESENRLRKMQQTLLPDNAGLVAEMERLAFLYQKAGKYAPAESLYQRVAIARQDEFGQCDRRTLRAYVDIMEVNWRRNESDKALSLHQDLDARIQQLFDPSDGLALRSRRLFTEILCSLGRTKEGERLQRETLQVVLGKFGQRHKDTIWTMRLLGDTMRLRGEYVQSERLLSTALQIAMETSEVCEEHLCHTKFILGIVLRAQGQYAESLRMLKDVLSWSTRALVMDYLVTPEVISHLAVTLRRTGQLEDSEILLARNTRRLDQTVGTTDQYTRVNILEYAVIMIELGCWTEAADLFEQSYRIFGEIYGPHHEHTAWAREQLDYCYKMQGLYNDRGAFEEKLNSVVESKANLSSILTQRRKYGRITGARDDECDEVEEIRPEKKRRTMTCTFNLKAAQR